MNNQNVVDPFEIDAEAAAKLAGGMSLGGQNELPFAAPLMWWLNGNPQSGPVANTMPALYYGGWAIDQEKYQDAINDRGGAPVGFVESTIYTRQNKSIKAHTGRIVVAAPITYRQFWKIGDDGPLLAGYAPGARQHLQMLVMVGNKQTTGGYLPWGPAVLSVKGYQAKYLLGAMKDWQKMLAPVIRGACPQLPAWAFYMGLGTFGKDMVQKSVGKNAQSPITPVGLYVPKTIDAALLKNIYVGKDSLAEMADLLEQAQPWVSSVSTPQNGAHAAGGPEFDDEFIPNGPDEDDAIPF